MFAVLKTGGKQYKVAENDIFLIEKLEAEAGSTVRFDEVLMLGGDTVTIGAPRIDGAAVLAEVLEQTKGPKVISFVKRRRKHSSQRKRGHRQQLTRVRITSILTGGAVVESAAAAAVMAEAAEVAEAVQPGQPAITAQGADADGAADVVVSADAADAAASGLAADAAASGLAADAAGTN